MLTDGSVADRFHRGTLPIGDKQVFLEGQIRNMAIASNVAIVQTLLKT